MFTLKIGPVNVAHLEPLFSYLAEERKQIPPQSDLDRLLLQITTLLKIHLQFKGSRQSGDNIGAHFSQRQVIFEINVSFPAGYRALMYLIKQFITP